MDLDIIQTWWGLTPVENIKQGCELMCPTCKKWSVHTEWKEVQIPCELCGDHDAAECPKCGSKFDNVDSAPFKCRIELNNTQHEQ